MPKYILNSFLAGIFSVTFSMSPYAFAGDSKAVSEIKTRIKDLKVETTKSYPEMFARMATQHPKINPVIFRQLAKTFQDEKFPKTQVQDFKYKGKDALKVISTVGGEQVVVEYLLNGNEVLKINGTIFNQNDVKTTDAFSEKLRTIPAYAKAYKEFRKKALQASTTPTFEQWKRLSKAQRAEYHLRFRQLLEAAYQVYNTPTFKVVSNNSDKTFDQWVNEIMMGENSYAAGVGVVGPSAPPTSAAKQEAAAQKAKDLSKVIGYNQDSFRGEAEDRGPSCIVAAYAMEWKGNTCPWNGGTSKGAAEFYKKYPISEECRKEKGANWIACNPIVYGFNDNGGAHCINTSIKTGTTENFNHATHGSGPCENRSPLNTAEDKLKFIRNILKRGDIAGAENLKIIKNKANGQDQLVTDNEALFKKIFDELQGPLTSYVDSAKKICEEVNVDSSSKDTSGKSASYKYKDINKPPKGKPGRKADAAYQDQACDALMKRALSVKNLLTLDKPDTAPIAKVCEGWAPVNNCEEKEVGGKKECGCKDGGKPNPTEKVCVPDTGVKPEPITPEEPADGPTAIYTEPADCSSIWSRINPVNSDCKSSFGDWFKVIGGSLLAVCAVEAIADKKIFGMCYDKPKKLSPPVYTDPACSRPEGCTTPVSPLPVTPPVVAPRLDEGTTNQNMPSFNKDQIPPR